MSKSKKSFHLWFSALTTLFVAIIGGVFLVVAKIIPEQSTNLFQATIEEPKDGQIIGNEFDVVVKLDNVPEGYHIWTALEINNLLWFKQPEIRTSDHKSVIGLFENSFSTKDPFSLSLIKVSSRGQSLIDKWFLNGQKTGKYPGINIKEIPEAVRIDVVHGLKIGI